MLPRRHPRLRSQSVLNEEELAPTFQHAPDLGEPGTRVAQAAERPGHHNRIHAAANKGDRLGSRLYQVDRAHCARGHRQGTAQKLGRGVEADHALDAAGVKR